MAFLARRSDNYGAKTEHDGGTAGQGGERTESVHHGAESICQMHYHICIPNLKLITIF